MESFCKRFDRLERAAITGGDDAHVQFLLDALPSLHSTLDGQYDSALPRLGGSSVSAGEKEMSDQTCRYCYAEDGLVHSAEDGEYVCTCCGHCEPFVEQTLETCAYGTPMSAAPCIYKRSNHFRDWLLKANGDEATLIDASVIGSVRAETKKRRQGTDLTAQQVRAILKKIKQPKYYENAQQIANQIAGTRALRLTARHMEKLEGMFAATQKPFEQARAHVCPDRKNFLSYSYVLHKFCELLNLDEFLPRFPLLRSRDKLRQQDRLWKAMCAIMQWEFLPSL